MIKMIKMIMMIMMIMMVMMGTLVTTIMAAMIDDVAGNGANINDDPDNTFTRVEAQNQPLMFKGL